MNILSLLILIPFVTIAGILVSKKDQTIRMIALLGSVVQLGVSIWITLLYMSLRKAGATGDLLFQSAVSWFAPLHIFFRTGVDGISLTMILLTAMVVIAGILVSWKIVYQVKEFFFLIVF